MRRADDALQVLDILRTSILAGHMGEVGDALPPEAELMAALGAGRNVVREALDGLRQEGIVERVRGAGTFIVTSKLHHRFSTLRAVGSDLEDRDGRIRGEILREERLGAPELVATFLGVAPGELLHRIEVRTFLDDQPCWLTTSYFLPELVGVTHFVEKNGDWYLALEALGYVLGDSEVVIEAVVAGPGVATLLCVEVGSALMRFERRIFDHHGRPLEIGFVRSRGDKVALVQTLPRVRLDGMGRPPRG
ncbi:GntR family transcriptional regulator [Rhabdothermincola salaria]|uniref:GntR family transcriptional regulator n=1 Tax=Rhabdothermincola salaria TaxID=2903142 RepID=UPI001E29BA1A|nr:GntR family transcriptional regulator [Rhabdothermincola salaria]